MVGALALDLAVLISLLLAQVPRLGRAFEPGAPRHHKGRPVLLHYRGSLGSLDMTPVSLRHIQSAPLAQAAATAQVRLAVGSRVLSPSSVVLRSCPRDTCEAGEWRFRAWALGPDGLGLCLVHHLPAVCHWPGHLTHSWRRRGVTVFRGQIG